MSSNQGILIFGATGMLGSEVVRQCQARELPMVLATWPDQPQGAHKADITNQDQVNQLIADTQPTAVINCCAWTDVDGAETNESVATTVNGTGVGYLAQACHQMEAKLVHVSTDYVFAGDGARPYQPDDPVAPAGAYGRSKLAGEQAIQKVGGHYAIIRTSWLFGAGGKNFVDTIVQIARQRECIKVVNDQVGCPTWTVDLARCLIDFALNDDQGIFHFCNPPQCTWYDLACEAIRIAAVSCQVQPCTTAEFPRPAPRPAWSVMDCTKTFAALNWQPRPWQQAVKDCLKDKM